MIGKGKRMRILVLLGVLGLSLGGVGSHLYLYYTGKGGLVDWLRGPDAADPGPMPEVRLVNAYPKLKFDLPLFYCTDHTNHAYVVEQDGRIWRFKNDPEVAEKKLFLDIVSRMDTRRRRNNEEGLLALALHPKFADNGYFFIHYSMPPAGSKNRRGVTSRFTYDFKLDSVNLATEKIIMEIDQPYGNHNGCMLLFGTDGYMYSSFGDGGAANDPHGHGQNLKTLLSTILRFDIDKEENGKAYAIPADNPFVGRDDACPEIWAYGLRNAWRFTIDPVTGAMWTGDVGQNSLEEIDIVVKGGNYGWNTREGTAKFRGDKTPDMIDPVAEYGRKLGVSVTGGYVYRGKKQPDLEGIYVYADYASGRIWGLKYDVANKKSLGNELLAHAAGIYISSFGEDNERELYACGHRDGKIYRVEVVPGTAGKKADPDKEEEF
jgi:glucose/arabinose dehydrogenase